MGLVLGWSCESGCVGFSYDHGVGFRGDDDVGFSWDDDGGF